MIFKDESPHDFFIILFFKHDKTFVLLTQIFLKLKLENYIYKKYLFLYQLSDKKTCAFLGDNAIHCW